MSNVCIPSITEHHDMKVIQTIPSHSITVFQLLDKKPVTSVIERHLLLGHPEETRSHFKISRLSSCIAHTNLMNLGKRTFQPPHIQLHTLSNQHYITWFEGFGCYALTLIARELYGDENKPFYVDLMRDVYMDPVLNCFSHQAPLYCWMEKDVYGRRFLYHVVSILWDKSQLNRPNILYRVFQSPKQGFTLKQVHQRTLGIHSIESIYFGGVRQSDKMYWNVDPRNEEFPIQLAKTPFPSEVSIPWEPPVKVIIDPSYDAESSYYMGMNGLNAVYAHREYISTTLHIVIRQHFLHCIHLVKKCAEKWTAMTLRPPRTLHELDPGGMTYQSIARKYLPKNEGVSSSSDDILKDDSTTGDRCAENP